MKRKIAASRKLGSERAVRMAVMREERPDPAAALRDTRGPGGLTARHGAAGLARRGLLAQDLCGGDTA